MPDNGFFITFEGGEASGKTTQIKNLEQFLKNDGQDVIVTREPGGTPAAEEIRNLLSHQEYGPQWTPHAELMLFFAARAMHIKNIIAPALKAKKIVLCDRYIDSTRVYQSALQGIDLDFIIELEEEIVGEYIPNFTLVFDIKPEASLKRLKQRGIRDHYDAADISVHQKLYDGFKSMAAHEKNRCVLINADQDEQIIAQEIAALVQERMK